MPAPTEKMIGMDESATNSAMAPPSLRRKRLICSSALRNRRLKFAIGVAPNLLPDHVRKRLAESVDRRLVTSAPSARGGPPTQNSKPEDCVKPDREDSPIPRRGFPTI